MKIQPCPICDSSSIEIAYNTRVGFIYCLDCNNELIITVDEIPPDYYWHPSIYTTAHDAVRGNIISLWNLKREYLQAS